MTNPLLSLTKAIPWIPSALLALGLVAGLYQIHAVGKRADYYGQMVGYSQKQLIPGDTEGESKFSRMSTARASGGDWAIASEIGGLQQALWAGFSVGCALGLAGRLRGGVAPPKG